MLNGTSDHHPFQLEVQTVEGPRLHRMEMVKTQDPVTGKEHVLWHMRDISREQQLIVCT